MILTTLTTMAGFLSMLLIRSEAIKVMGVAAAAGIFIAGAVTWFCLPVLLLHIPKLQRTKPRGRDRVYSFIAALRGRPSILLTFILIAAAVPGLFLLRANFNMLSIYKKHTEVRRSIDTVNQVFGGSLPVWLYYEPEAGLFSPETAGIIQDMEQEIREAGIAEKIVSLYDIISNVGGSGYPESEAPARLAATMIRRAQPGLLETFVNTDQGAGRVLVLLGDLENETLERLTTITAGASGTMEVTPVGIPFVLKEMNDQIIPQQFLSLLFACGLVLAMISLAQRSLKTGAIAILPILVTLVVLFGVMGYSRIDLSVITGIMSGLTIGVGIDYAIHYVSLFRHFKRTGIGDPVEEALRYVSSPVLANAIGLALGFSAMAFSPLRIHVYLAVLMWVTMISSAVLCLSLLPTLLSKLTAGPVSEK
jgi:predicted RND superfamily exporter protein